MRSIRDAIIRGQTERERRTAADVGRRDKIRQAEIERERAAAEKILEELSENVEAAIAEGLDRIKVMEVLFRPFEVGKSDYERIQTEAGRLVYLRLRAEGLERTINFEPSGRNEGVSMFLTGLQGRL